MRELDLGHRRLSYAIIEGTPSLKKSIQLIVHPESGVRLVVPVGVELTDPDQLIRDHADQILHQLEVIAKLQSELGVTERNFTSGETIPYLGRDIRLEVEDSTTNQHTTVTYYGDQVTVRVKAYTDPAQRQVEIREAVLKWYFREAKAHIPPQVQVWATRMNLTYNQLAIKNNLGTRWASCSDKRNLAFNSRLMMCPQAAIDYTIVHELCHLTHPNHTGEFWALVAQHYPDYKTWLRWFKHNSLKLRL